MGVDSDIQNFHIFQNFIIITFSVSRWYHIMYRTKRNFEDKWGSQQAMSYPFLSGVLLELSVLKAPWIVKVLNKSQDAHRGCSRSKNHRIFCNKIVVSHKNHKNHYHHSENHIYSHTYNHSWSHISISTHISVVIELDGIRRWSFRWVTEEDFTYRLGIFLYNQKFTECVSHLVF